MVVEVGHIGPTTGREVVDADYLVTPGQQLVTEVGSEESPTAEHHQSTRLNRDPCRSQFHCASPLREPELPGMKISDKLLRTGGLLATPLRTQADCFKWGSEVFKAGFRSSQRISNGHDV